MLIGDRLETDKECETRIKKFRKKQQRSLSAKEKREIEEKELYLKLHKKHG